MEKYNILLVDDQEENLSSAKDLLHRWGYSVDTALNGDEAIESIKNGYKEYAAVVLDYRMPGKTGTETAEAIRAINAEVILLVYSAYPTVESVKATIRAGALNFIDKNEDVILLKNSIEKACLEYEKVRKIKPPLTPSEATKIIASIGMVGRSNLLARVVEKTLKFRNSHKAVLILGETGTGKEMIARALHAGHSDKYFVVNCASFQNNTLMESELFGHEKGGFTGAINRKVGILESAKGGTVYFDELHHMDPGAQAKLLRSFRLKTIRRVSGVREEVSDFRLITSSWPNIDEKVKEGSILQDFYYRIKQLTIEIPPLRQRPEDIEPLITHFCEKHFKETGVRKQFLVRTVRALEKYSWPGNVAELESVVSGLIIDSDTDTIDVSHLDPKIADGTASTSEGTYEQFEARQANEKRQFLKAVMESSKSPSLAAQKIGLKPSTFHSILSRLGIRGSQSQKTLADRQRRWH